jgi:hypothetical protein
MGAIVPDLVQAAVLLQGQFMLEITETDMAVVAAEVLVVQLLPLVRLGSLFLKRIKCLLKTQ